MATVVRSRTQHVNEVGKRLSLVEKNRLAYCYYAHKSPIIAGSPSLKPYAPPLSSNVASGLIKSHEEEFVCMWATSYSHWSGRKQYERKEKRKRLRETLPSTEKLVVNDNRYAAGSMGGMHQAGPDGGFHLFPRLR